MIKFFTKLIKNIQHLKMIKDKDVTGYVLYNSRKMNLKLLLDLDSYIDYMVYMKDHYDIDTLNKLDEVAKNLINDKELLFFDIGSNIGLMSLYLKKKYKDQLSVYGFEPISKNYYQNKMNGIINKLDIDLYQFLLGNENKKNVKIFIPDRVVKSDYGKLNMGMSSIYKDEYRTGKTYEYVDMISVETFVNTFLKNRDLKKFNALFKIDVEGSELNILKGMMGILERFKSSTLIVECLFDKERPSYSDIVNLLKKSGFKMYDYNNNHITNELGTLKSGNYIFMQ